MPLKTGVTGLSQYKTFTKYADAYLKKNESDEYTSALTNKALSNAMQTNFGKCFDSKIAIGQMELQFSENQAGLKETLGGWQISVCRPFYSRAACTSFCLPEVRLSFEGQCLLVGVKYSAAPGDTMDAKVLQMMQKNATELFNLAKSSRGFCVNLSPGTVLAIPADFLVVAHGLGDQCPTFGRYGIFSKADQELVSTMVHDLMQHHAFLKGSDYDLLQTVLQ